LGAGTSLEGDRAIHLLDEEIGLHRSEVRTTQWSVSIGEIFSLYDREQLNVNPVFQRFFRWSDTQKGYIPIGARAGWVGHEGLTTDM
jgi:hypothetical protein